MIRQPIVVLCGHVDHGKSSILEKIKGISITKHEEGGITQTIKSYNVPLQNIKNTCGKLLDSLKSQINLPGLLFLDTPGHAAFGNLRKRGGSLADIAILVIDINEGIKPQTIESIEILRESKTPFVIALNKIDKISGWQIQTSKFLLPNIESQSASVKKILDDKLYAIVGDLYSNFTINAERYDRVDDFTKTITIIPLSAKTLEGLPELLMMITGLAQKFLEETLNVNETGPAKATVLEVTEQKGMGTVLDVVVYDGMIKKGDKVLIGTLGGCVDTKVKGLFVPGKNKLEPVNEVHAAASVVVSCQDVTNVIAGMPMRSYDKDSEKIRKEILDEIEQITFEIDNEGIVIKADAIGSLEALITILKEDGYSIKRASIGNITKKDIVEADAELEPLNKVVLGFNVGCIEKNPNIKIIVDPVIYRLVENFKKWREETAKEIEGKKLQSLTLPCKFRVMEGFIFRQSNPAVVGVEVLLGKIKRGMAFYKEGGKTLGEIKDIQKEGTTVTEALKGEEVAVSMPGITVGRQLKEGDILYSSINEDQFRQYKELKKYLNEDQILVLKEIAAMKRKEKPIWGI